MAYSSSYHVQGAYADLALKQIIIETNFKIDTSSISMDNILLYKCLEDNTHDRVTNYSLGVDKSGKNIVIQFENYPEDNSRYYIIVKNLVELMHGSISVESKKGIGSMFTVDLPFSIPKIDELSSSKSINDLRVLVVDNDCASRIYMTSILDRINVQYDIATTTEQTVKMLSTADKAGKHYDICFIDCKASFADSITLTKNIRKIYDKKALVIILSAYDISEIGENMETSGADIFLQKPLFQSTVFNMLISLTDKNYIKGTFHKESYDFHGKKVLLAEDNALNTEIAIELLNSVNLNVDHAENGQIAVDKFLTAPIGTYDIILMDIQMPVMNGYQATKTIRSSSHPNAKSIPIFAMTADAFTENVAEALSAGMNGHIAKPIDTHILYRTLCNCLRQA